MWVSVAVPGLGGKMMHIHSEQTEKLQTIPVRPGSFVINGPSMVGGCPHDEGGNASMGLSSKVRSSFGSEAERNSQTAPDKGFQSNAFSEHWYTALCLGFPKIRTLQVDKNKTQ